MAAEPDGTSMVLHEGLNDGANVALQACSEITPGSIITVINQRVSSLNLTASKVNHTKLKQGHGSGSWSAPQRPREAL